MIHRDLKPFSNGNNIDFTKRVSLCGKIFPREEARTWKNARGHSKKPTCPECLAIEKREMVNAVWIL